MPEAECKRRCVCEAQTRRRVWAELMRTCCCPPPPSRHSSPVTRRQIEPPAGDQVVFWLVAPLGVWRRRGITAQTEFLFAANQLAALRGASERQDYKLQHTHWEHTPPCLFHRSVWVVCTRLLYLLAPLFSLLPLCYANTSRLQ